MSRERTPDPARDRSIARAVQAALKQRKREWESLTHDQQRQVASILSIPITRLTRALGELRSVPPALANHCAQCGYPLVNGACSWRFCAEYGKTVQGARNSVPGRDVVRSTVDRIDEDHDLRTFGPAQLAAIDEVSRMMRLDLSKSPSLRREYIDARIVQLREFGRHNHTKDGDDAWGRARAYRKIMDRGVHEDLAIRQRRELDQALLRRKRAQRG